ncbi:MAG TPA: heme-dependent oxidative N-demethylase subunit alpha family protein [Ramlibacter sp.]|nr:heme-dependent oxidative N-demethylase subunit alpha family protein [Ramlibacter sp.]
MDFDLGQIAVPFRMQPGLARLAAGTPQLTPLDPASGLFAQKSQVVRAGASRHALPGFDPAPALEAIARHAADCGLPFNDKLPLELAFEEDLAVLDGATGTLPWLAVCVPSHWAPQDKLGLHFTALHAPVADNAALLAAAAPLVQLVTGGDAWERHVWTISPSGRYDQHPRRHGRAPWPDSSDAQCFAQGCWLRAERQTFLPVGRGTRQAVFTIRVMLQPLVQAVDTPEKADRLHDALASMSDAVLAYKNLATAREPLLRWLQARIK